MLTPSSVPGNHFDPCYWIIIWRFFGEVEKKELGFVHLFLFYFILSEMRFRFNWCAPPGACVIKLFTVSITTVIFFVRCYKNLKKNSRVFYPNMMVIYPEILALEKEGFLNFFDGQIGHG